LAVGSEPVQEIYRFPLETGTLKIISPTDAVKDRLLGYFYWRDRQSLQQTFLIARDQEVDFDELDRWAQVEDRSGALRSILREFPSNRSGS
jgi:hypothetical protein